MKVKKIFYSFIAIALILTPLFCGSVNAASGFQGYAIYRDGVLEGYEWHGAIMNYPYANDPNSIIEANKGVKVTDVSWATFLGKDKSGNWNTYKGAYVPKGTVTSYDRDQFVSLARKLAAENIGYMATGQIDYSTANGNRVQPWDIYSMRCDGVVEYIFEYLGFKVYGGTSEAYWNISIGGVSKSEHSGARISPKSQATQYLRLISTNLP